MQIADLGVVITGKTPTTKKPENWNGDVPFITPGDLQGTKNITTTSRYVSDEGLRSVKGARLPKNSICVSCIGVIGYVGKTTRECITNQQINSIIVNEKHNSDYVYYLMKSLWPIFKNFEGQSTTLSILNKGHFSEIEISERTREEEDRIANILNSLDAKIELNNAINQNLSEQIQTIYDELIEKIDADPIEISSVIDVRDGTHDSPKAQETGLPLVTSKHLLPYGVDLSSPNKITKDDYDKINERSRVDTFDILLSMIGTVGIISLVVDSPVEFAIKNVGLFKTSATPELYPFVLAYLRSKSTMQHIEKVLAGSTQKYVSLGELRKLPIALPNSQQLIDFNAVVKPIIEQIIILTRENKQLTVLRDSLLPKLMFGEIDVSEIEI